MEKMAEAVRFHADGPQDKVNELVCLVAYHLPPRDEWLGSLPLCLQATFDALRAAEQARFAGEPFPPHLPCLLVEGMVLELARIACADQDTCPDARNELVHMRSILGENAIDLLAALGS